jgi:hypothetical protein
VVAKKIAAAAGLLLIAVAMVMWVHFTGVRLICHSGLPNKDAAQRVASSLVRREFGDDRATRFSEALSSPITPTEYGGRTEALSVDLFALCKGARSGRSSCTGEDVFAMGVVGLFIGFGDQWLVSEFPWGMGTPGNTCGGCRPGIQVAISRSTGCLAHIGGQ